MNAGSDRGDSLVRRWVADMLSVVSFSEAGGHLVNEDAFAVECHPADPGSWLCCLADGQGGRAGGARAALLACRTALDAALRQPPSRLVDPLIWPALLRHADESVRADPEAGRTTLVGFCVAAGVIAGASCGDSAVLLSVRGESPRELTEGQLKNPPVGSGAAPFRPFGAALGGAWGLLAVSDGVWKYAGWDRIREAVADAGGRQLIERLQGYARLPGSGRFPDDFTVVLLEETA